MSNEVLITEQMINCAEKNYNSVSALFRASGFVNVKAVPLGDLNLFTAKKNNSVKEITINGDSDFEDGDVFPKTANVIIIYHSFRQEVKK